MIAMCIQYENGQKVTYYSSSLEKIDVLTQLSLIVIQFYNII